MNTKKLMSTTIAGIVAVGLTTATTSALAADEKSHEKCYGIAKMGKNDCGTSSHSCSGQSTKDSDASEWIYLPNGTCDKIVGGSTSAPEKTDDSE